MRLQCAVLPSPSGAMITDGFSLFDDNGKNMSDDASAGKPRNAIIAPRTPSGTLELLPREQMAFQHMLDVIRRGYESFGFVAVETPVFEMKDVLLTKSGGETEKQVYFVQSTGAIQNGQPPDLALRFDLTVPLARYVAEHERELAFPFRRYQIQRVYRGERPQRGRMREFYQCDIDVIGKDRLDPAYDAELPAIIVRIFRELGLQDFTINFSNRKVLLGLMAAWGLDDAEKQKLAMREIDKLDKIGVERVAASLAELGIDEKTAALLLRLVGLRGSSVETLAELDGLGASHPLFAQGLSELRQTVAALAALGVPEKHALINLAIARGLDYYTGTVYETFIGGHPEFGSVCSGGRYDDLAGHYTKSKLPGVGISIGATRLFDQLRAADMLPPAPHTVDAMIANVEEGLAGEYLALAARLRATGLNVENYLETAKLEKQLKYADRAGIPQIVIIGATEREKGAALVKDMAAKTQREVRLADLPAALSRVVGKDNSQM